MSEPTAATELKPFAEKEYIDLQRAMQILGVSYWTVVRLAHSGMIDWLDHGKVTHKRIRYQSVVDYCNQLRAQHRIADRRPLLSAPFLRHRDEDLLPFPLKDTVSAQQALEALGFGHVRALVRLIEEGCFEAYQLVPQGPWRISRGSLLAYLDRLRQPPNHTACYKVSGPSGHF